MTGHALRQLPNIITTLRLLLAVPICVLILTENYQTVLWVAVIAGLSDGVDGWLARKFDCVSRYGSTIDPLADKVMLVGTYVSFALVGLLPWWVATIVVVRDLIIITGALTYHLLFGSYNMEPTVWGKVSTCVQITLALMLLGHQVYPIFPAISFQIGIGLLLVMAVISGSHYLYVWGGKALTTLREQ